MPPSNKNKSDQDLFGKRSIRSYLRQAAGALSELPIFENKYYDLFRTPLDTFQERFPEGGRYGWRTEDRDWVEADTETLYDLWRRTGAPNIEDRPYPRPMAAPREYTFSDSPNELQKALGYLFGSPRMIIGTESPKYRGRAGGADLVAESAHGVMFENPQKYGSRREQIAEMKAAKRKGMTSEEEFMEYYGKPGTSEYIAHSEIEPQIIKWLQEQQ